MTNTEKLKEIYTKLGGNPNELKDNLYSTYLDCINDCLSNGTGGGSANIEDVKLIAKNLGVECTDDDDSVDKVIAKIADEMPLIAGEKVAKKPLEVNTNLQGLTLLFDTSKTIPAKEGNPSSAIKCYSGGPFIQIIRTDESIKLAMTDMSNNILETFYENGTWYMDCYTLTEANIGAGDKPAHVINEEMHEYVSAGDVELGLYEKVEMKSLFEHVVNLNFNGKNGSAVSCYVKLLDNSAALIDSVDKLKKKLSYHNVCSIWHNLNGGQTCSVGCLEYYYTPEGNDSYVVRFSDQGISNEYVIENANEINDEVKQIF